MLFPDDAVDTESTTVPETIADDKTIADDRFGKYSHLSYK
jgi:hypothetical protein